MVTIFRVFIGVCVAVAFLSGAAATAATVKMSMYQDGNDVRLTLEGSLDLGQITSPRAFINNISSFDPSGVLIESTGSGNTQRIGDVVTGPDISVFSPTSLSRVGSATGDSFGFNVGPASRSGGGYILVNGNYRAGEAIKGQSVFANTTLDLMGAKAGTYTYQLGTNDTAILTIAAVPLPAAGFLMIGALGGLFAARRCRKV